jgi:predicted dehydrogenase
MVKNWRDMSVLIAGCGSIGKRHARVLHDLGVHDIRACDPSVEQLNRLTQETPARVYSSYEQALAEKPEAVFICTAPKLHIPMATDAIEAGAHVFCEKPLAYTSDGVDALAESARRAGRSVTIGFCYRYHDGLLKAKGMLASGHLGRLVSIRCLMGEHLPSVRPDYRSVYYSAYSGAFELIHGVDLAVWFARDAVKKVRCLAGNYSDIGIEASDFAEILIEFESKCLASIHLDFFQVVRRFQIELICTAGIILIEFGRWDHCVVSSCGLAGEWSREEMVTARDDMFRAEDSAFLLAAATGQPVDCGIDEARKSLEIVERAKVDADIGSPAEEPI